MNWVTLYVMFHRFERKTELSSQHPLQASFNIRGYLWNTDVAAFLGKEIEVDIIPPAGRRAG